MRHAVQIVDDDPQVRALCRIVVEEPGDIVRLDALPVPLRRALPALGSTAGRERIHLDPLNGYLCGWT
jgi:hypothetical protein